MCVIGYVVLSSEADLVWKGQNTCLCFTLMIYTDHVKSNEIETLAKSMYLWGHLLLNFSLKIY